MTGNRLNKSIRVSLRDEEGGGGAGDDDIPPPSLIALLLVALLLPRDDSVREYRGDSRLGLRLRIADLRSRDVSRPLLLLLYDGESVRRELVVDAGEFNSSLPSELRLLPYLLERE